MNFYGVQKPIVIALFSVGVQMIFVLNTQIHIKIVEKKMKIKETRNMQRFNRGGAF